MRSARKLQRIDGVLLLDKPLGPSSNTLLQHVKHLFNAQRAGHTGTLDPRASGLLPVCLGEATKFGSYLLNSDKAYAATIRLGVRTESGDSEGRVIEYRPVTVDRKQLDDALDMFRGDIEQVPPMFSALKIDGQALYKLARQGVSVERPRRKVTIRKLELEHFEGETVRIYVRCSKGTYIRTLAEDIGQVLGCGGHLESLRRLEIGEIRITEATTLETLEALDAKERLNLLFPIDFLVSTLPRLVLQKEAGEHFAHGQDVEVSGSLAPMCFGQVRVYEHSGDFMGIGEINLSCRLVPCRLIAEAPKPATIRDKRAW